MDNNLLLDRYKGCMLGLAIGDALGMPADFMTPYEVMEKMQYIDNFMMNPHTKQEDGTYTGVTQVAMLQAMAIIKKHGKFDEEYLKETYQDTIKRKKSRWTNETIEPLINFKDGLDTMMAPLAFALMAAKDPTPEQELLISCSKSIRACGVIKSKGAILASFCIMWLVKELIRNGKDLKYAEDIYLADGSIMERLVGTCRRIEQKAGMTGLLWKRIDFARKKADEGASTEEFVGLVGNSWNEVELVPFSLFRFMKAPDDMSSVFATASMGGAASLSSAIVGLLIGAYVGPGYIKDSLRNDIEGSAKIMELSKRLLDSFSNNAV